MTSKELEPKGDPDLGSLMESVLIKGDLAKLSEAERVKFYNATCNSLGLNPLTQPFAYIFLNGKLTLYAKRDCCDQLRRIYDISIVRLEHEWFGETYHVTAHARMPSGRIDQDFGAVFIAEGVKGEARANLMLKCVTKAKRRVTLSICGLGFLDETEIEDIPDEAKQPPRKLGQFRVPKSSKDLADQYCEVLREMPNEPSAFNYKEELKKQRLLDALELADRERVMDCYRMVVKAARKEAQNGNTADNGATAGK